MSRGVSSFLAVILLIGLTVALMAIVGISTFSFTRGLTEHLENLDFVSCYSNVAFDLRDVCLTGNSLRLVLEHKGTIPVERFFVRMYGLFDVSTSQTEFGLAPYAVSNLLMPVDLETIGPLREIEIFSVIKRDRNYVACDNFYKRGDISAFATDTNPCAYLYDTCQNAQANGLCDGLDIVCGLGYKASCCKDVQTCC